MCDPMVVYGTMPNLDDASMSAVLGVAYWEGDAAEWWIETLQKYNHGPSTSWFTIPPSPYKPGHWDCDEA